MKISDLIENLQAKDQDAEVEFIVCKTTGEIVCAKVEKMAARISNLMKMFR